MTDPRFSGADPAREPDPEEDETLLAVLAAAGDLDPVPPDMDAAARAGFAWRTLDAELAELTYDSLLEEDALAGMRGVAAARSLTFDGPRLSLDLEASASGRRRRLMGQVVPPQQAEVEVRSAQGSVTVAADEAGRFSVDDLAPGPVSLRVAARGATVVTDWVLL